MDEKTPEPPEQPELDPMWRELIERMMADKTFGLQMSMHIQRNLEVHGAPLGRPGA